MMILLIRAHSTTSERLGATEVKLSETTDKLIETNKLHKEKTFIVQKQKDTESVLTAQAKEVSTCCVLHAPYLPGYSCWCACILFELFLF